MVQSGAAGSAVARASVAPLLGARLLEEGTMPQSNIRVRVSPSEETIELGGLVIRFLIKGADSNGTLASFELSVPAGQRLPGPPHSHDRYEETIYGITGVVTWIVDGTSHEVGPGQALCIPRGAVHTFENRGERDAKSLCVITPGVLGPEYFREVLAIFQAAAGGPPDQTKMADVMRRHGLTPV